MHRAHALLRQDNDPSQNYGDEVSIHSIWENFFRKVRFPEKPTSSADSPTAHFDKPQETSALPDLYPLRKSAYWLVQYTIACNNYEPYHPIRPWLVALTVPAVSTAWLNRDQLAVPSRSKPVKNVSWHWSGSPSPFYTREHRLR